MWPARGVAEHAYCPRLFYYTTVEGVFVPSSDTEEGNRGELYEGHFLNTASGCALTDSGRKGFFSAYGRRMDHLVVRNARVGTSPCSHAEISRAWSIGIRRYDRRYWKTGCVTSVSMRRP